MIYQATQIGLHTSIHTENCYRYSRRFPRKFPPNASLLLFSHIFRMQSAPRELSAKSLSASTRSFSSLLFFHLQTRIIRIHFNWWLSPPPTNSLSSHTHIFTLLCALYIFNDLVEVELFDVLPAKKFQWRSFDEVSFNILWHHDSFWL